MISQHSRPILLLSGCILILSLIVLFINHFIYHFSGNSYFPDNIGLATLLLLISYAGIIVYFKNNSKPSLMGRECLYLFTIMALIALATEAIQFTPFPIIDQDILAFEKKIHLDVIPLLRWTNYHPKFKQILCLIYNSLPVQMCLIPLLVICTCRFYLLREYYFLLLCTTLLGFGFYYFFPTTAPASILDSEFFMPEQIATGLKFNQIHQYITPSTNQGGLISLPSFHVIWAILCVNLIRVWVVPCIILAFINILLIFSCVSLGWHYYTDVIGSMMVLLVSYYWFIRCRKIKTIGML